MASLTRVITPKTEKTITESTAVGPSDPVSEQPIVSPSPNGDSKEAVPPVYSSFTQWEKRFIVLGGAIAAFFSPLTAQIYFPALNTLAAELHVTDSQINLTVTTYMIFQGLVPMFVGGFADTGGRRPAYVICFVLYIAANIGVALSQNYASLLVLRCLQSAGSASTIALCQAVVADTITSAERGQYIGITVLPVVLAPSLGPVLGGVLTQYLGWRAIFWFLTIAGTITLILMVLFFPETCRNIVGDGSIRPHPAYRTLYQLISDSRVKHKLRKAGDEEGLRRVTTNTSSASRRKLHIKFGNPFDSLRLLFQKEMGLLLGYNSIVFAGFYCIATALPSQFAAIYNLTVLQVGLMYLPLAGGSIVAAFVMGPLLNKNYRRHARLIGMVVDKGRQQDLSSFPIERARLQVGIPLLALATCVITCWGWALQQRAPIAVPCVLLFLLGVAMIGFNNTANVLIVDIYPAKAGAAVAANNVARCLVGAGATALILPLINAVGSGWAFTILGAMYAGFSPALLVIMRKGMQWRREEKAKIERKRALKEGRTEKNEAPLEARQEEHDTPNEAHAHEDLPRPSNVSTTAETIRDEHS